MKRVLLLSRHFYVGGVTSHIILLAKGLRDMGWDVAVASGGDPAMCKAGIDSLRALQVEHYSVGFPQGSRLADWLKAPFALGSLQQILSRFRPDVVHAHWRSLTPFVKVLRSSLNSRVVVTLHSARIAGNLLARELSWWGDATIAISSETRELLESSYRVPANRIITVPNGVDCSHFRPPEKHERFEARAALGLSDTALVLCEIARMIPAKRQALLIRALSLLRTRGVHPVALLAGDGPEFESTRILAEAEGVSDQVRMLGTVDPRPVLWASDACVLPSTVEGFPLTIIEAMHCGVVPLRTPAGGYREQISDGVDGLIFPFDDPASLADAISQIADPNVRGRLAGAAVAKAQAKFTLNTMLEGTLRAYGS